MILRVKLAVACLAAGLLSGCSMGLSIGEARNVVATGSPFSTGLYHGYLDLAEMEYSEGDYGDSDYFSRQAVKSAANNPPKPKDIRGRSIPTNHQGRAIASRARLMRVLEGGGRSRWPLESARAQVMFDCWMQEQEEGIQPGHIAACRNEFLTAINRLEAALGGGRITVTSDTPPDPTDVPPDQVATVEPPEGTQEGSGTAAAKFLVYFAFDRHDISPTARNTIREAAERAKKLGAKRIDLIGHADRSGEVPYNHDLSMERSKSVAEVIKAAGLDSNIVSLSAMGENMPAVKTADGVRNFRNRRVEIRIAN